MTGDAAEIAHTPGWTCGKIKCPACSRRDREGLMSAEKKRSGTNVRRRKMQIGVRLTSEEWQAIMYAADALKISPGEVLRRCFDQVYRPEGSGS